jgi:hypothetical protein
VAAAHELGAVVTVTVPAPSAIAEIRYVPSAPVVPVYVAPELVMVAVTTAPPTGAELVSTVPVILPTFGPVAGLMQLVPIDTAPPASSMHMVTTNLSRVVLL